MPELLRFSVSEFMLSCNDLLNRCAGGPAMKTIWSPASKKILTFAIWGATGCLLAAMMGELFLLATRSAPTATGSTGICLVLDSSGSMAGGKLLEMKAAARDFVDRRDLSADEIAVVSFDSQATVQASLSNEADRLRMAILGIVDGGSTNMSAGIDAGASQLNSARLSKSILLFTDGQPDSQDDTLRSATDCRNAGIAIVAVATGDADIGFLEQVTGEARLVFSARAGGFDAAFKQAERAIGLVDSSASSSGWIFGMFRVSVWTALLSVGVSLALIAGQNIYLRRVALPRREALIAALSGLAAGAIAGALGQFVFSGTANASAFVVGMGRLAGWTILGALLGLGLAFFVPNLKPSRGALGGAIGGAMGALGFILGGLLLGDVIGRWLGAAVVGFCIGAMIAWAEAAFREAWLEIRYGPKEQRTVSLGNRAVVIGSDREACTVYLHNAPPVALKYTLREGTIQCEDIPAARMFDVRPGDVRNVGNVEIAICAASSPLARASSGTSNSPTATDPAAKRTPEAPAAASSPGASYNGLVLRFPGRRIPLPEGVRLGKADIAGLETASSDGAVAEVVRNPANPEVLGLKNLSLKPWSATTPAGEQRQIEPGRSIKLAAGTKVRIGNTEGIIE